MIFCTKCGAQLDDSAKFCPQCGTAVLSAETPQSAPAPEPTQQAPVQQPQYVQQPVQPQYQQPMQQPQYQQPVQLQYAQQPMQQMQYGQPVPQYAGGYMMPTPKKKKTGLIIALIAIGAVVIAGVVVLLILLLGGGGRDFVPSIESYFGISAGREVSGSMLTAMGAPDGVNMTVKCYGLGSNDAAAVREYCQHVDSGKYDVEMSSSSSGSYYYYKYVGEGSVRNIDMGDTPACFAVGIQDMSYFGYDMILVTVVYADGINYGSDGSHSDRTVTDNNSDVSEILDFLYAFMG